jgi:hypothetical protein
MARSLIQHIAERLKSYWLSPESAHGFVFGMGICREQSMMHWRRWLRHGTCPSMAASLPFSLLTNWKTRSLEFLSRTCFDLLQCNCRNSQAALTPCQAVLT